MSASRWIAAGIMLLAAATSMRSVQGGGAPAEPADRKVLPDSTRSIESPRGRYRLVLEVPDADHARAILMAQDPALVVWERRLAHEYGPRFALVSPHGTVVLLDEWINVVTGLAISVIDGEGRTLAVVSTGEIATLLGHTRAELLARGRFGPWMGGTPELSGAGEYVAIPMGERELRVSTVDGSLTVLDRAR